MLKKLFGKRDAAGEPSKYTTEDLIVLERWDEAIAVLEARVQSNPNDLHAHLKLAEVYTSAERPQKALERYLFVAESYTDDGFYDKAIALLSKIARLAPGDSTIAGHIRNAQQLKDLEHLRTLALEGLRESQERRRQDSRLSLTESQRLWQALSSTEVVRKLPGEQLRRLFAHSWLLEAETGEVLAERDSRQEVLYLLASGEVEALLDLGDGRPIQLRSFGTGDIFGDRALLEHQPWPATYRACGPSRLFRLDAEGLAEALQGNPDPRQFLDALRSRRHDHDVAAAVRKLVTSSA